MKRQTSVRWSLTLLFGLIFCLSATGRSAAAAPTAPSLVSPADGAVISEPSTISFVGMESKRVRAALEANDRRGLRQRRRELTPEDIRENRVSVAIAGSVAWRGWDDGETNLACTPENLRAVFRAEHILQQAEQHIARHADFFATSSRT